jgi:predicted secreted protein
LKNLLIVATSCLLILLGAVILAAAAEMPALQAQDSGREIQVKAGATVELSLLEQAGTGYQWEFDRLDEKHFKVVKTETRPLSAKPRIGGPVLQTWRLIATTPGESQLSLDYFRPWEGRAKAAKHFQVKVRIHK